MTAILRIESQHHQAWVVLRRIGSNVAEVEVEGHEGTTLANAEGGQIGIDRAAEPLVDDCIRFVPCRGQQRGNFDREVLVDLEPQPGRSLAHRYDALARQFGGVSDRGLNGVSGQ